MANFYGSLTGFGAGGSLPAFSSGSGGTESEVGDYRTHTFTGTAEFTYTAGANNSIDYLVIGGGAGGGGGNNAGGGGGAGGYRYASGYTLLTTGAHCIEVGGPGTYAQGQKSGGDGPDSVFDTITSTGGGGGGGWGSVTGNPSPYDGGHDGGSGGGKGGGGLPSPTDAELTGVGNTPITSPSQGNNGGTNIAGNAGAGGGGAGSVGVSLTVGDVCVNGGNGGSGSSASPLDGTSRAGGGGGGVGSCPSNTGGTASSGGGAGGTNTTGSDATPANYGSGGGGGGAPAPPWPNQNSGAGSSGLVILKYKFQ